MDFGFYTDFQNVAYGAPTTTWDSSIVAGLTVNEGIRRTSEFLAPRVPCQASPGGAYAYQYYSAQNVVPSTSDMTLSRGQGGKFPFIGMKGEAKTGTLKNYGVAVAVEKSLVEASPEYEIRAVRAAYSILETAIVEEQLNALSTIATSVLTSIGDCSTAEGSVFPLVNLYYSLTQQGSYPNRMVVPVRAWMTFLYLYSTSPFISAYAVDTVEDYARQVGLEGMLLTPSRYSAGSGGVYGGLSDADSRYSYCYLFSASPFGDSLGNTNIATFTNGDVTVSSFDHPQGELRIYTVSIWFDIAVLNPLGVYKYRTYGGYLNYP